MLTSRVSAHIAALVLVIGLCVPAASQAWNFGYRSSQGSHAYGGYGYRHQGSHAYGGYGYRHQSPRHFFGQRHYRRHYQTPRYGYYQSFRPHRPYYRSYYYPHYRWCPY